MARRRREWVGRTDDSMPPQSVRLRLHDKAGGVCPICSLPLRPGHMAADHIKPLADGGANAEGNLRMICTPCHAVKTAQENKARAKADRVKAKRLGLQRKGKGFPKPAAKNSKLQWDWRLKGTRDEG